MKRLLVLTLVLTLLALLIPLSPVKADSTPVGSCPTSGGFTLMPYMDMGGMPGMDHLHAGLAVDLNGDGYICMAVVDGGSVHVHVDDYLPLQ